MEYIYRQLWQQVANENDEAEDLENSCNSGEDEFRRDTFLVIVDSIITGVTNRFESARNLKELFSFLWEFNTLDEGGGVEV